MSRPEEDPSTSQEPRTRITRDEYLAILTGIGDGLDDAITEANRKLYTLKTRQENIKEQI